MTTSQNGVDLIKEFEGLELKAYYDSAGVLTIGYGHTNLSSSADKYPVYEGQVITEEEAETILKADLKVFEDIVNSLLTIETTQNQFDALVSFTFNLGGKTLKESDLLRKHNAGDFIGASEEFQYYVHAGGVILPGLVRRREAERQLYLNEVGENTGESNEDSARINAMIKWMEDRKGKVTYSMEDRNGPDSYDCSSAVYHSLVEGTFLPEGSNGNTDTLFDDLERNGWTQIQDNNGWFNTIRGDIFIWGIRGASTGSFGHTGIFYDDNDNIIHCNYGHNGITIDPHDEYWLIDGKPHMTMYRYTGTGDTEPENNGDTTDNTLIAKTGTFVPDRTLSISGDTTVASPALGYYDAGESIFYDSYTFNEGYAWISYISYSGSRHYIAVGPDDGDVNNTWGYGFFNSKPDSSQNLIPLYGTFIPDRTLSISGDTTVASPALGYYNAGEPIIYDSYTFNEGYAWISYISYSGSRHYIAVGPDDGRYDTSWGTGFFDNGSNSGNDQTGPHGGKLISKKGTFIPDRTLSISGDTTVDSPALGYYDAGESIFYDSYIFNEGYAWISYISYSGSRHYIAVGPDDGNVNNTWGTGFFN